MNKVSKEQFFISIGPKDVILTTIGIYPYITEFKTRGGTILGRIVDKEFSTSDYFLSKELK